MENTESIPAPTSKAELSSAQVTFSSLPLSINSRAKTAPPSPWSVVLAGFVAAEITAYVLCTLPPPHTQPWITLLFRSIAYVAFTAAAGALGIFVANSLGDKKTRFRPALLIKLVGAGWLFFPCIALLYRQYSLWIILAIAIASFPIARSLNQLASVLATREPAALHPLTADHPDLPSLNGLPRAEFNPLTTLLIGVCAQGALIYTFNGSFLVAGALLSGFIFLTVWRWSALTGRRKRKATTLRTRIQLGTFAILLTFLALIQWSSGGGQARIPQIGLPHKPPSTDRDPSGTSQANSGYYGIILLPPPAKKVVVAPPPDVSSSQAVSVAKPLVIPFDGPYWYFRAPNKQPGAKAHVAHGKSTEVNIHSTDRAPLLMEAHQNLGLPIDLHCCREIDLAIVNADVRPGQITLGLLLTDSTSPATPSLYLGEEPILSSQPLQIPLDRPAVKETLRFLIPPAGKLAHFDKITVIFLPDSRRAAAGAKVAVENFTLLPK
jgi:hypothetical protein